MTLRGLNLKKIGGVTRLAFDDYLVEIIKT